ncbi:alpha/beta hydrolase [Martelella sp. FLE1502]
MIDPELEPFLELWREKWSALKAGATPAERRKRFEAITHAMRLPTPTEVDTAGEHWVETDAGPVRVRIFRHTCGGVQPCLIFMHGGGFAQGSPESHWDIAARIAAWNRQTVVSIDYALAPEEPFPAAINQCTAVARWTHANAEMFGIDRNRIAVGGDSAGGNLAATMALDLRGSEVPFTAQLLIYPACDFDTSRPSYLENPNGPMIRMDGAVEAMYCPNVEDRRSPRYAPLLAESHAGLPPAYIAVAEHDPLRDSGRAYAQALREAGVAVTLDEGTGLIHGYLRALEFCEASRRSLVSMAAWLDGINKGEVSA